MSIGYGDRDGVVEELRLNNVRFVHGGELSPDPLLTSAPLYSFIGKHVKVCFGKDERTPEHMWVSIERVENSELVGTLANNPVFVGGLEYGDEVRLAPSDIEMVETLCGCKHCPLTSSDDEGV
jgi:hypothetical protein